MGEHNPTGYSAAVRLWLVVQSQMIPLSHASSTFVIAKHPVDLPPGEAAIVFTVDEARYERAVTLVNGMSIHSREAAVRGDDSYLPF